MKLSTVLFDLDGTLLPMDLDKFTATYFGALVTTLSEWGMDGRKIKAVLGEGIPLMIKNTGKSTNEEVFWEVYDRVYGRRRDEEIALFDKFYQEVFDSVSTSCGYDPAANCAVKKIKKMGLDVALATNPLFPKIATEKRIKWAGLDIEDFLLVTSYENSRYSKPNPDYYLEVLEKLGKRPEECLMVGNDVRDDMSARHLGMKVFVLTDCLINPKGEDVSDLPKGSFSDLIKYIEEII